MEKYLSICETMARYRIGYRVHYPTPNSCVFSVGESVNNAQLTALTNLGATWDLNQVAFVVLVADLGLEGKDV